MNDVGVDLDARERSDAGGRVVVAMDHRNKRGESELLKACTLPLIDQGGIDRLITDLGVLDVIDGGCGLVELADGVSGDELRSATGGAIA